MTPREREIGNKYQTPDHSDRVDRPGVPAPLCPICFDPMKRHGEELATHCGRCYGWDHARKAWVRLSRLFGATRLKPPRRPKGSSRVRR